MFCKYKCFNVELKNSQTFACNNWFYIQNFCILMYVKTLTILSCSLNSNFKVWMMDNLRLYLAIILNNKFETVFEFESN